MTLASGMKLGPYEVTAPLGAGGMGEVYRARDARLERDVAIKVLPERTTRDERALSRFRRETKALAALSHPNILMILDVGEHEGVSYAVMELLEGETLRERLRGTGVDLHKALEIAAAVADGLAAAHARDIVHRDLKPENLFLTRDGVVKILDFGLARTGLHTEPSAATATATTQPGVVLGTVNYMSPEQVRGQPADARCDIFSLGCVLYEMLSGQPPFLRETAAESMTAILRHHPKLPSQSTVDVPPDVDPIVMRCLEKSPDERFNSARDLAFSLRSALGHGGQRRRAPPRTGRVRWAAVSVVGLIAVAAGLLYVSRGRQTPPGDPIDSIAVLPFVNASGDPDQEYFVDGMTDALIADLAKIRALKVISRTSAMQFKGAKKPLPDIARALDVKAVVEGSVLRVGDRVRITAQLIRAATEENLWADSYDRDLRDVLRLQSEVARTIAQEIRVTLTPQEQARLAEGRPVNPEAYEAYLKGRHYWNKRTPGGVEKAVVYFEQAVALAPDWPLGYAGLADAYALTPQYCSIRPSEAMPKAQAAAKRALEMDESLGEAHATLAFIASHYDWDWPTAEREYQRALALSPNYATGHHWYALYLLHTGRPDEAIKEMTKAQELDPLSLIISSVVGMVQCAAGNLEQAETGLRETLELGPDFPMAHLNLANALFLQGRLAEAITEAREAVRLSNNEPLYAARLGYMCARAGQPEEARRILEELTDRSAEAYVPPTQLALVHAGLDERDRMFEWLEDAYQERAAWLPNMLVDPLLASMRTDPRFADLVRRVGLPPLAPMPSKGASSKPPAERIMLAVLPFENLSRDPEQEFFSDGMTDELISQLGRINPDRLDVIARTSAMRYKKTGKSVDQIGRELNVDYVVEGTVRRADGRVRINAQLVHVDRQTHLWSEAFDRDLKDILALQSDVARAVAQQINVKLNPQEEARLAATRVVNPVAHEAYMRGRFHWNNRTRAGMQKAIEHFRRAIELDPDYAPAYAGLADCFTQLARHGHVAPKEAFPLAKQAALKAVELDEGSAEAHGALAFIAFYFDWDWSVAERELRRALDLNESYEEAHHQFSHLLLTVGRPDESLTESRRALELNPLDLLLNVHLGWHYAMSGQNDRAIAQYKSVLELDSNHYQALRHIGWAYMYSSLHAEAIAALEAANKLEPDNAQAMTALAAAYAAAGRSADARKILQPLEADSPRHYVSACDIAAVYAALGKAKDAFAWLEKAIEERSPRLVELTLDPIFDPLRSDPRFDGLVRRVGLPQIQKRSSGQ